MKRILTALLLLPTFIYIVGFAPQLLFFAAVTVVASLAFHEYRNLVALHDIEAPTIFSYAAGVAVLLWPRYNSSVWPLIAAAAMVFSMRSRELRQALPYAGAMLLGIAYTFGTLRCAVELREISPWWALFALSLNWVGDIVALYVGRSIGRHKLAPRVSPGKSWEGSVASVLSSMLYAALYFPRLLPSVPIWKAVLIAGVANFAGQLGDLSESALKRGAGVKDSGTLLPGHGGWLDRIDSSLFALPVVYVLTCHFQN